MKFYVSKHAVFLINLMDGWMSCDFTPFSTVFQSYQGNGEVIMKDCVQFNAVYD